MCLLLLFLVLSWGGVTPSCGQESCLALCSKVTAGVTSGGILGTICSVWESNQSWLWAGNALSQYYFSSSSLQCNFCFTVLTSLHHQLAVIYSLRPSTTHPNKKGIKTVQCIEVLKIWRNRALGHSLKGLSPLNVGSVLVCSGTTSRVGGNPLHPQKYQAFCHSKPYNMD